VTKHLWPSSFVAAALLLANGGHTADAASSLQFYALTPCRIIDTRGGAPLQAGIPRDFLLRNTCGVPTTASAAMLNVTMVTPSADGFTTIWQAGLPFPNVSNINALAGEAAIANGACVPLAGGNTDVSVVYGSSAGATAHVIIDVLGYFQ
jgi:hypothetical protein